MCLPDAVCRHTHHLGRLGPRDVKLEVRIFFPVAKKQREFVEESVVGVAKGCERLGAGVAVQATLQRLACLDEAFPILEAIRIGFLLAVSTSFRGTAAFRSPDVQLKRFACAPRRTPPRSRRRNQSRSSPRKSVAGIVCGRLYTCGSEATVRGGGCGRCG